MTDERINTATAHKGIDLETTLCANGVINCRSDRGSGDVHSVFVDATGSVNHCTCKGWTNYGTCYHADTIDADRPLCAAARACSDRQTVATDGGQGIDDNAEYAEREGHDPAITYHTEPEHLGGARYARCEECGAESVEDSDGDTDIMHDSTCSQNDSHIGAIWPDGVHDESELPDGWDDR